MRLTPTWRVGVPQLYAALLLLVFLCLCLWRAEARPLDGDERAAIETGRWRWRGQPIQADAAEPPLTELLAAAAAGSSSGSLAPRLPTVLFGLALGGSLWYVARRLYGNAGGYIALALYCFSPQMILRSAHVDPGVLAAWGFFGVIFTAIGAAHTLHAPLGDRLWRLWLLGLAIGIGTGAYFFVALSVPAALAFMLYLVPERRPAAFTLMAASFALGATILLGVYGFDSRALAQGLSHARWLGFEPAQLTLSLDHLASFAPARNLSGLFLVCAALVTYALWPRCRYFGNTAPLLVAAALVSLALVVPTSARFLLVALPFAFVFIAGTATDLLETPRRRPVVVVLAVVLVLRAAISLRFLLAS